MIFISATLPCTQSVIPHLKGFAWGGALYLTYNGKWSPDGFLTSYRATLSFEDMKRIRIDYLQWTVCGKQSVMSLGYLGSVRDVYKQKYANSLIRSKEDIKLVACPPDWCFAVGFIYFIWIYLGG